MRQEATDAGPDEAARTAPALAQAPGPRRPAAPGLAAPPRCHRPGPRRDVARRDAGGASADPEARPAPPEAPAGADAFRSALRHDRPIHRDAARGSGHLGPILALLVLVAALLASGPALAQDITLSLGDALGDGSLAGRSIQLLVLITVLSLVPGLAVTVTCFPFVVTVLSILRQAIGLQQSPPNMLIVSLALFLTWFVMEPVLTEAWVEGVRPLLDGDLALDAAARAVVEPFRGFMAGRVAPDTFATLADLRPVPEGPLDQAPLSVLVPSFLLSEIERAFQVGFLIFLPFLVIDLVVAAVLMSMGMMMVPPAIVALPFKLAFFVAADGWALVAGSVVESYF